MSDAHIISYSKHDTNMQLNMELKMYKVKKIHNAADIMHSDRVCGEVCPSTGEKQTETVLPIIKPGYALRKL